MVTRCRWLLVGLILLGAPIRGVAQLDSLVRLHDITFVDGREREAFKRLQGGHLPWLDLLCTPYNRHGSLITASVAETIRVFVNELASDLQKVPEKKKPAKIYEAIHRRFLKRYQLDNAFIEIFETGNYNCVSATALHALVFEQLQIPYQIKEMPQHVYLVAYPTTHNIIIETTDPIKGYLPINEKMTTTYAGYLLDENVINEKTYKSESHTNLFNTFYYSNGNLSLLELSALQYCNYAVYAAGAENYPLAINYYKKAYLLSPSQRAFNGLVFCAVNAHLQTNQEKQFMFDNFKLLCKLYQQKPSYSAQALILKQVEDYVKQYQPVRQIKTNAKPIASTAVSYVDSAVKYMWPLKTDTLFIREILFVHYEVARLKLLDKQFDAEIEKHLMAAYAIAPENIDLRTLILGWFIYSHEDVDTPEAILNDMPAAVAMFPFLKTHSDFLSIKYYAELEMIHQYYERGLITKGEQALKKFEAEFLNLPGVKLDEKQVEQAYGKAASYYYRLGQKAKTREVLKRGLVVYPSHYGLMRRLEEAR